MAKWPFKDDDLHNSPEQIEVCDDEGRNWLVLKSIFSADEGYDDELTHLPFRRSAFVRVSAIIVQKDQAPRIADALDGQRLTDPTDWEHIDVVDGPFYLEYPWRKTWDCHFDDWEEAEFGNLAGIKFVRPVLLHMWESHLDLTLPNGLRTCMPSVWLARKLNLRPAPSSRGVFVDENGETRFLDPSIGSGESSAAVVDQETFLTFLDCNNLECLWIVAGEKSATPTGQRENWGCRYHSAIYRWTGTEWIGKPWFEDRRRGLADFDCSLTDR